MNGRPWLAHYEHGVPHTLEPYPELTLLDFLRDTVRERPDHPFLWFKGRRFSWSSIDQLSDRFAAALVKEGVRQKDRVALVLPNCPQMVIAQLGIWKAGAIAVPLNPLYTETELQNALVHVGAEIAVVLTLCYSRVKSLQSRTNVRRVIATNIKDYLPSHLALLFTLAKEKKEGHRIVLAKEDAWFKSVLRNAPAAPPSTTVGLEDAALLLFTGGTTGTPKAAIIRHHGLVMAGMQLQAWGRSVLPPWESVTVSLLPLFHVYGMWMLATGICARYPLALVPNPRDFEDVLATIRRSKAAYFPAVPALFAALLEHPRIKAGKPDLKCLKVCSSGAAPLMVDTLQRWENATGIRIVEGYALTESCVGATANPVQGVHKTGSVGIPMPDVEVRIVNAEGNGESLPAGQIGEIVMRAPQMIRGYWGMPPTSESMLREGWLYTGDLGYLDEDGYLFIVDRKKDVIKASGFQVWPREVEEVISSHPAVAQVGVAGVPDPQRGEAVKAWIVLKQGTQITAEGIREHCRQHLAAYKVPRHVEFRGSLPTSAIGKTLRRELRAEAIAAAQGQNEHTTRANAA
jgi:long-chain acyl-CoA synthetase